MSFAAFRDRIVSTDLRQVVTHWNEVRGDRAAPGWKDIRPSAIARQLPIVWSYAHDPASGEFVGRLAGDVINQLFGRNLKGMLLSELGPQIDTGYLASRFREVIGRPALFRGNGVVFRQDDHHGYGERIIMPLSEDGCMIDGIFGATQYQLGIAAMATPMESEEWLPLS